MAQPLPSSYSSSPVADVVDNGAAGPSSSSPSSAAAAARPRYTAKQPSNIRIPSFVSAFIKRKASIDKTSNASASPTQQSPSSSASPRPSSLLTSPSKKFLPFKHSKGHSLDHSLQPPPPPATIKGKQQHPLRTANQETSPVELVPRDLDKFPHGSTPQPPQPASFGQEIPPTPFDIDEDYTDALDGLDDQFLVARPDYNRSNASFHTAHGSFSEEDQGGYEDLISNHSRESQQSQQSRNGNMGLTVETITGKLAADPDRPKSPNNLASFFGWGSKSPKAESPPTTFSDSGRSVSPMPSPLSAAAEESTPKAAYHPVRRSSLKQKRGDHKAASSEEYEANYPKTLPSNIPFKMAEDGGRVDELLREVRELSTELAHSIKREMDIEDELDRLRSDMPSGPHEMSRRTSDYFSDSGTSSLRNDNETKIEVHEKMRRKAEQEKAQLRNEMSQKLQGDLDERRALERHVKSLEEQIQNHSFQSEEGTDRERELSATVEDYKRRLKQEQSDKGNFEDILAGMREELQASRNERDNLRDEVVPQLKARVEGLEADAAKAQTLQYENAKMSQELQSLNGVRRPQNDTQGTRNRDSILSPRTSFIQKVHGKDPNAPSESLPERLKDVEEQRDTLQKALQAAVTRQEHMTKRHMRQLKVIQAERDSYMSSKRTNSSIRVELHGIRGEMGYLRQRANDAFEQKYQCEKGLGGIQMDLDRSKQEIGGLRSLLKTQDMFSQDEGRSGDGATLEATLADLQRLQQTAAPQDASRIGKLHDLVQSQVFRNKEIRERMARAITRGENEQTQNAKKLVELEAGLRQAEEMLTAVQQTSDEVMQEHEDHVRKVKATQTDHALRGVSAPAKPSADGHTPANLPGRRNPKVEMTRAGRAITAYEAVKPQLLQARIRELEEATAKADRAMEYVVEEMNRAQMEVSDLQAQRDEAIRETRRLQHQAIEETGRARDA